jgi:ferredoxin
MLYLSLIIVIIWVSDSMAFSSRGMTRLGLGLRSFSALSYKVTIVDGATKTVLDVDGDTTVLEAALEAGIELDYDCQMGVCLTCPSKVTCGSVSQDGGTLDDSVIEQGYALTCVTRPTSDCTIQVIPEDELVSAQFER